MNMFKVRLCSGLLSLVALGVVAVGLSKQVTVVPLGGGDPNQCCVCRAADGSTFKAFATGGSQSCSIACSASGGIATGSVTACYVPQPAANPGEGLRSGFAGTDGGNCKGNNWCKCGKIRAVVVQANGEELPETFPPRMGDTETFYARVGEEVTVRASIEYFGGTQSGRMRVALGESAVIVFGDIGRKYEVAVALRPAPIIIPPELEEGPMVPPEFSLPSGVTPPLGRDPLAERKRELNFQKQIATHTWSKPGS
jgi:hypothetical protein